MTDHPAPNPNQPDALVEKAAEALWRASQEVNGFAEERWAHVPEPQRASWRHIARAVLAAVLPEVERHAKADAFDEGWIARSNREPVYRLNDGLPPHRSLNPYREKGDDRG